MDAAAVAEPTNYTIHPLATIGERVSALEGTIDNQNRIFDMLHEGQKNLMVSIAELRADTDGRIAAMDARISERINEINGRINETNEHINETNERIAAMELGVNERIAAMDVRLNTKIDSNLKWMLGVQIAMWVTIIVAVLL
ncbi:MAG: hypothetical protein J7J06_00440 [Methanosarcinales archaeon]|nr:hypothetical protein [Methanosarcinales archaeon]